MAMSAPQAAAALDRAAPLHEGVLERVLGADALVRVQGQHLLQQVRQVGLQTRLMVRFDVCGC